MATQFEASTAIRSVEEKDQCTLGQRSVHFASTISEPLEMVRTIRSSGAHHLLLWCWSKKILVRTIWNLKSQLRVM